MSVALSRLAAQAPRADWIGAAAAASYARQTRNLTHSDLPSYFSEIGTTFEANLPPHHDARDASKRQHPHLHWPIRQIDALLNAMDALGCGYAYCACVVCISLYFQLKSSG